ncbi:uncharacterized protein LOC116514077 [Thamnophis elegans]|uniref:uncharacterized protein LOC116514077 n=1 Tax=Thamnophis elegans TaxID=35005 RepID=UPI0013777932|nr:uncharacterized protein LOC116514077 [Thamnophis elegans]
MIQASRRPSTIRIYEATWSAFSRWCLNHHLEASSATIPQVLEFLQDGLDKGLAPNTLRRQVAALSTILSSDTQLLISRHPQVKGFLKGESNLCPPPIHRYPTWDLTVVLQALTVPPFEPLRMVGLRHLTLKAAFLVTITSARRISELAALSIRGDLCIFHPDRVILRLDPAFIPKINTVFHRAQEMILPDFCPQPRHQREVTWHKLDVRRAVRIYIKRTAPFRKSEALFVSFQPASMGKKVTSSTIGRWLRVSIKMSYETQARPIPSRITAHSTRSAATSAAWATQAPIEEICCAAMWSGPFPFIRNYRLDTFASAEPSFGRRVLQRVVASNVAPDISSSLPTST